MAERVSARLTATEGRRFGLVLGPAFLAIAALLWWRERHFAAAVASGIGGLLVLGGLAFPSQLGPVHAVWMGLASILSKITTPILMGVVYFAVLTPVGMLARVFRRNPVARARSETSYWITRPRERGRSNMEHQF